MYMHMSVIQMAAKKNCLCAYSDEGARAKWEKFKAAAACVGAVQNQQQNEVSEMQWHLYLWLLDKEEGLYIYNW